MTKLGDLFKPKRNWSRYSPPHLRPEPTPPPENEVARTRSVIQRGSVYDNFRLKELRLPDGVELSDVSVEVDENWEFGEKSYEVIFYTETLTTRPNPKYESMKKKYDKDVKLWNEDKKKYTEELAAWKAWVKQCDDDDRENELKRAEKLLRDAGRLK